MLESSRLLSTMPLRLRSLTAWRCLLVVGMSLALTLRSAICGMCGGAFLCLSCRDLTRQGSALPLGQALPAHEPSPSGGRGDPSLAMGGRGGAPVPTTGGSRVGMQGRREAAAAHPGRPLAWCFPLPRPRSSPVEKGGKGERVLFFTVLAEVSRLTKPLSACVFALALARRICELSLAGFASQNRNVHKGASCRFIGWLRDRSACGGRPASRFAMPSRRFLTI